MKKLIVLIMLVFLLTGCSNKVETTQSNVSDNTYTNAILNDIGNIVIDTTKITEIATFINYKVDNVTIQLIVVRASDGTIKVVFNTCKACNPDKKAYYIQEGKYLVCQTCNTKILIDDIGGEGIGCMPFNIPSENIVTDGDNLIVSKSFVEGFKEKFINWQGILS